MAALTIRQLEDSTKMRLRMRAASNGRSMEAEAREILQVALHSTDPAAEPNLAESIRKRFAPFRGVELNIPKRASIKPPPRFEAESKRRSSK